MTKYLINRILRGLLSVVAVVAIVMLLIYSLMNRDQIFAQDSVFSHMQSNEKETYKMRRWEEYGYLDYVPYGDYLVELKKNGEISDETYTNAVKLAFKAKDDSAATKEFVEKFTEYYESRGYKVRRLDADVLPGTVRLKPGGAPALFAYRDVPLPSRLWDYFTGIFRVDNIHWVPAEDDIGERGLTFTLFDPLYGGEKFSPAIIGNGTQHKYLLYFDSQFPYIHQNVLTVHLGTSYSISKGIDVFNMMTETQGSFLLSTVTYPSGNVIENRADNPHTATYVSGSLANGLDDVKKNYVDDYTNVTPNKNGLSKMGYSFVIGIISVILAYIIAIPLGTLMALKKDTLIDKLGTIYIVFIMAVPSLAYIFLFREVGASIGLPDRFDVDGAVTNKLMYILPIVSLALPSIANLMKWLRRYMIDQMNSDYVKFARSGGLSEGEIFSKHVLKNAIIPIVHGIPGSVLGAMVGAIITERVYSVPGAGNLLTNAINAFDNGVIVGMALFYALLSVVSVILGDILMALVDPRISFVSKAR